MDRSRPKRHLTKSNRLLARGSVPAGSRARLSVQFVAKQAARFIIYKEK